METLGDHLGAEENIDLAGAKIAEDAAEVILALEGIGIHAGDARLGKEFREGFLDAFRADAGVADGGIFAVGLGTNVGSGGAVTADMTDELLVVAMVGE